MLWKSDAVKLAIRRFHKLSFYSRWLHNMPKKQQCLVVYAKSPKRNIPTSYLKLYNKIISILAY